LPRQRAGDGQILARWIDDNLPYSSLFFFPTVWAVNINWHERPVRRVDSFAEPKGAVGLDSFINDRKLRLTTFELRVQADQSAYALVGLYSLNGTGLKHFGLTF
jgi:hypothetical protein